jgi:hypothetical protein
MLKPKHCYAREETFNRQQFLYEATVLCYAIDIPRQIQVRFILNNDKTRTFGTQYDNGLVFMDTEKRSVVFTRSEVENMITGIEIIRNKGVSGYNDTLQYSTGLTGRGEIQRQLHIKLGGVLTLIADSTPHPNNVSLNKEKNQQLKDDAFYKVIDRLDTVLKQFIKFDNGESWSGELDFHVSTDNAVMVPLYNKYMGYATPSFLRLSYVTINGEKVKNHIAFCYKGRTVLFYKLNKPDTSSLRKIIDGFIEAMRDAMSAYEKHPGDNGEFISSIPVELSEDRKHFMEYVGVRGLNVELADPASKPMIMMINSDAGPGSSKVVFHTDRSFLNSVEKGLHFLTSL